MNGFLKSKTMWFSYLTMAAALVQQISPFIPEKYTGVAMGVIGAATAALRTVTTQPLSDK